MKNLILVLTLLFPMLILGQENDSSSIPFTIPPYFVAKSDCYIKGAFDADGSNTVIRFENNRTQSFNIVPIMESKDKVLIHIPDVYGEFELIIADEGNGNELFIPIKIVKLDVEYDKLSKSLKKPIAFKVKILGAEHMEEQFLINVSSM